MTDAGREAPRLVSTLANVWVLTLLTLTGGLSLGNVALVMAIEAVVLGGVAVRLAKDKFEALRASLNLLLVIGCAGMLGEGRWDGSPLALLATGAAVVALVGGLVWAARGERTLDRSQIMLSLFVSAGTLVVVGLGAHELLDRLDVWRAIDRSPPASGSPLVQLAVALGWTGSQLGAFLVAFVRALNESVVVVFLSRLTRTRP